MKNIYTEDHLTIASRLRSARSKAGLSQVQAAKQLGRTQSHISKVENGQTGLDIVDLKKFCKIYKCDLNQVIE